MLVQVYLIIDSRVIELGRDNSLRTMQILQILFAISIWRNRMFWHQTILAPRRFGPSRFGTDITRRFGTSLKTVSWNKQRNNNRWKIKRKISPIFLWVLEFTCTNNE